MRTHSIAERTLTSRNSNVCKHLQAPTLRGCWQHSCRLTLCLLRVGSLLAGDRLIKRGLIHAIQKASVSWRLCCHNRSFVVCLLFGIYDSFGPCLIVKKLAAVTIGTVKIFVESLALFGFVVSGHISTLLKFMRAVSEWARILILTGAAKFPKFANFCLKLHLEALRGHFCMKLTTGIRALFLHGSNISGLFFLQFARFLMSCRASNIGVDVGLGNVLQKLGWCRRISKTAIFPGLRFSLALEIELLNVLLFGRSAGLFCWSSTRVRLILRKLIAGKECVRCVCCRRPSSLHQSLSYVILIPKSFSCFSRIIKRKARISFGVKRQRIWVLKISKASCCCLRSCTSSDLPDVVVLMTFVINKGQKMSWGCLRGGRWVVRRQMIEFTVTLAFNCLSFYILVLVWAHWQRSSSHDRYIVGLGNPKRARCDRLDKMRQLVAAISVGWLKRVWRTDD